MKKKDRERFTDLAARLRKARLNQGRSLRDVAESFGVNPSMVRVWELGVTIPSGAYFIAWVEALGFYLDITDAEEEEQ